ncbi:MAG: ATP-binding protein [Coriobacteriales bacterium]|nr:ATP-binding protein [Coriobacteriales bacterium]
MPSSKPFSPSFGNRPSQLVGRGSLLEEIAQGLRTEPGSRERAVVLLGQRGTGKTVLLWEIADRARALGFVVANPTTSTEGMLDRIVEKVQADGERREARGPAASVSGAGLGALGSSIGLQFTRETMETKSFHYKLGSLCSELSRRDLGVLILVDELQASSSDLRQLVSAYQELVGEGANIALVLAGLPSAVSGVLNDRVLTFLNRATRIVLEPLAIGEVDAYFCHAFEGLGMEVPPGSGCGPPSQPRAPRTLCSSSATTSRGMRGPTRWTRPHFPMPSEPLGQTTSGTCARRASRRCLPRTTPS